MPIPPSTRPNTFYIGSVPIITKQILAWFLLLLIGFGLVMLGGWLFSKGHDILCAPFFILGLTPYFVLLLKISARVGDFIFSNL
jgi:hypothetical protein